jgi:1,4-dihydroxy-2-naphthoyl-CoA synthase
VPPGALKAAKLNLHAHAAIDWQRVLRSPLDVPRHEWQEGLDAFTQKRAPDYTRFWEQVRDDVSTRELQRVEGE